MRDNQRAPELLSYMQPHVGADGRMGLFLLTGSQQFELMSKLTQSLAGRTAFIELPPLSIDELIKASNPLESLAEMLFNGGYPARYDRQLFPVQWFPARH